MIKRLEIQDPHKAPLRWTAEVFSEPRTFEFGPGLNILAGPNGSGKSTVLKTLAMLTWCHQGGFPKVTSAMAFTLGLVPVPAVDLVTDGSPTFYVDPEEVPGYLGGMAALDYDFWDGSLLAIKKQSSGQRTVGLLLRLKPYLEGTTVLAPLDLSGFSQRPGIEVWRRCLADRTGSSAPKTPTLLLDEPDRALDLEAQLMFWAWVRRLSKTMQVIVSSHNALSLFDEEAHFVEITPGYMAKCRAGLSAFLKDQERGSW